MRTAQVILALSLPVTILLLVVMFTIIVSWGHGTNVCATWMASVLPFCK